MSELLTLHVFIGSLLVGIASAWILVARRKTISKGCGTVLIVLCVMAFASVLALIGLSIAFARKPPPPSPPVPG